MMMMLLLLLLMMMVMVMMMITMTLRPQIRDALSRPAAVSCSIPLLPALSNPRPPAPLSGPDFPWPLPGDPPHEHGAALWASITGGPSAEPDPEPLREVR
jgi:hypothetical protein